jgi:hypothetical protein
MDRIVKDAGYSIARSVGVITVITPPFSKRCRTLPAKGWAAPVARWSAISSKMGAASARRRGALSRDEGEV